MCIPLHAAHLDYCALTGLVNVVMPENGIALLIICIVLYAGAIAV